MRDRLVIGWLGAAFLVGQVLAIEPIPRESGVRGYVNVGAAALSVKNNTVAGLSVVDIGEERIGSIYESPDSESLVVPALNGEISYTWAETRSQVFLGNRLEDFIRFDSTSALGLRQEAGEAGILEGSVLFSGVVPEVWEDPYVEGVDRRETDRASTGVGFGWDRIFGSKFELKVSTRKVEIDRERSGESLGLSSAERGLLEREGTQHAGEVLYVFQVGPGHFLAPSLRVSRFDLDGAAMRNERIGAQLTHTYPLERVRLVSNLYFSRADYDKEHPVYGRTRRDDLFGLSVSGLWPRLLGAENWTGVAALVYAEQDSNIRFYDSEALGLSLSALYRF